MILEKYIEGTVQATGKNPLIISAQQVKSIGSRKLGLMQTSLTKHQ
jgi:hypothetical protein